MTQDQFRFVIGAAVGVVIIAVSIGIFIHAERYARYSKDKASRTYGGLMTRQFTKANVRVGAVFGILFGTLTIFLSSNS